MHHKGHFCIQILMENIILHSFAYPVHNADHDIRSHIDICNRRWDWHKYHGCMSQSHSNPKLKKIVYSSKSTHYWNGCLIFKACIVTTEDDPLKEIQSEGWKVAPFASVEREKYRLFHRTKQKNTEQNKNRTK